MEAKCSTEILVEFLIERINFQQNRKEAEWEGGGYVSWTHLP
jgi:hypothetical protein